MSIVPPSKPKKTRAEIETYARANNIADLVYLVGQRGYYGNTFAPAGNNLGVYDDAIFLVSPDVFAAFNGNCDPSTVFDRKGAALAHLLPGVYRFYKGLHKGSYKALRAFPEGVRLPCLRNGKASLCSAINIHKGGLSNTWSAGCQTIIETQYKSFIELVYGEMSRHRQETIPYILTEN